MNTEVNPPHLTATGKVVINPQVVFSLALDAALSTYGIVGISSRYTGYDTTRHDPHRGLEVKMHQASDDATVVTISIHVIAEYGVRISAVISSLQHQIAYSIQHSTGYCVDAVNVHVTGLRITHEDQL